MMKSLKRELFTHVKVNQRLTKVSLYLMKNCALKLRLTA